MFDPYLTRDADATPIELVGKGGFEQWLSTLSEGDRLAVAQQGFAAQPGQHCWLPGAGGVAAGWDGKSSLASLGGLPLALSDGVYFMAHPVDELQLLGWGLGCYQFTRYRDPSRSPARLVLPGSARRERLANLVNAVTLARDLINMPAGDLTPAQLADEVRQVADTHDADCRIVTGDDLLAEGFGAIHAVGRAAADPPRLVDVRWGEPGRPLVAVVGKGVCFDSGGLDIKTAAGMRTMKKDMGGAAAALGLAQLIMAEQLPVQLRLLIPAVENAIAGNAYRPGDILDTHAGITVEVDNTDAEGRLILCDALSLAAAETPELIVDFATPDRRGPGRGRHRGVRDVLQRPGGCVGHRRFRQRRRRPGLAHAAACRVHPSPREQGGRYAQFRQHALRGRHSPRPCSCRNSWLPGPGHTSTSWPTTSASAPGGRRAAKPWPCARFSDTSKTVSGSDLSRGLLRAMT